ncbi:MAG: hypothetical protein ACNA8W_24145 [Bradymonadaceae bacterium]
MWNGINIEDYGALYLLLALLLLGCLGIGIALIIRLLNQHKRTSSPESERPYSHLLPLLAADVLSPSIRRLYVKSLLIDATLDEHPDGLSNDSLAGQATRECRRLLNDLQLKGPPDRTHPLMTQIDAILDEALEIARSDPGDARRWQDLSEDFGRLRKRAKD